MGLVKGWRWDRWEVGLDDRWDCYEVVLVGGGIGGRCILNTRETPATHPLV